MHRRYPSPSNPRPELGLQLPARTTPAGGHLDSAINSACPYSNPPPAANTRPLTRCRVRPLPEEPPPAGRPGGRAPPTLARARAAARARAPGALLSAALDSQKSPEGYFLVTRSFSAAPAEAHLTAKTSRGNDHPRVLIRLWPRLGGTLPGTPPSHAHPRQGRPLSGGGVPPALAPPQRQGAAVGGPRGAPLRTLGISHSGVLQSLERRPTLERRPAQPTVPAHRPAHRPSPPPQLFAALRSATQPPQRHPAAGSPSLAACSLLCLGTSRPGAHPFSPGGRGAGGRGARAAGPQGSTLQTMRLRSSQPAVWQCEVD